MKLDKLMNDNINTWSSLNNDKKYLLLRKMYKELFFINNKIVFISN